MYIDPNTGGIIAQTLLVGFTALSGLVMVYSGRIKMFFAKRKRGAKQEETQDDQE